MSSPEIPKRTCKGICKKFHVKRPVSGKRYSSGQGHCQTCDTWLDHNGCRLKDGTAAQKNSVGWFCNCCNVRVRQKPRNKVYKEKLRKIKEKNTNIDETSNTINTHIDLSDDRILVEDISISKGQAIFLKKLSNNMPEINEKKSYSEILENIPKYVQFEIKDNWGNLENFLSLSTDYLELNKISVIILFEKFKKEIERVPSKAQFLNKTSLDEDWIIRSFKSWEHFLELLQYDPWYRNNSKNELNNNIPKTITKESTLEYERMNVDDGKSDVEIIQKMNELKTKLMIYYKTKDSDGSFVGYSHVEMFQLLENYLKLLPNDPKYADIKNFF